MQETTLWSHTSIETRIPWNRVVVHALKWRVDASKRTYTFHTLKNSTYP